jgi:hypothetical protein
MSVPRSIAPIALALLLPVALAACGNQGADADGAGTAASPAAGTASEPGSATPSPSPSPSAVPVQPRGAHDVTYRILNWEQYGDNPAVRSWKRIYELGNASVNARKMLPGMTRIATEEPLRLFVGQVQLAWRNNLHVKPVAKVRVQSATATGAKRRLVICQWVPSTDFYQANGKMYLGMEKQWNRFRYDMVRRDGRWMIDGITARGTCRGGAPR